MGTGTFAPLRLAFLDIDSTLTGNAAAAGRVRSLLADQGYMAIFNTSRTEEMVMTRASYDASVARGQFHRPPPHLGWAGDRRVDVPQEEAEPPGLLDPDIIAGSTGSRILNRQPDGSYRPDTSYGNGEPLSPRQWRHDVMHLIDAINRQRAVVQPAPIEYLENYERGVSDVYPPDYRVQLNVDRPEDRLEAQRRIGEMRERSDASLSPIAHRVHLLDDSEPRDGRYKAFLMPRWASKARAAHHITVRLCAERNVPPAAVDVLFVGDSYPDLHMALLGGISVNATLLLVGGSRLTDVLSEPGTEEFAGEPLGAVKRRLSRTERPGYMQYRRPYAGSSLAIVAGDLAFPGSTAVETVERYLEARR